MSRINVIVASHTPDVMADGIALAVTDRPDMNLLFDQCVSTDELDAILNVKSLQGPVALILVVPDPGVPDELEGQLLLERNDIVVVRVHIVGDIVRIGLRDPRLEAFFKVLRELIGHIELEHGNRVASVRLHLAEHADVRSEEQVPNETPLMDISLEWLRNLLQSSVEDFPGGSEDLHGFALTRSTVLQSLDQLSEAEESTKSRGSVEDALDSALADNANEEPLGIAARFFELDPVDFRFLLLALAPELDIRFQRCMGFLLDDMSRRVGTLSLYANLLGLTVRQFGEVRGGPLARWFVWDALQNHPTAADEPVRIDPILVRWLLGDELALQTDPRVRQVSQLARWSGTGLIANRRDQEKASVYARYLIPSETGQAIIFAGPDRSNWRAFIEFGAESNGASLTRIEAGRLFDIDLPEISNCAVRVSRLVGLTGGLLVIDVSQTEFTATESQQLQLFLATLSSLECSFGLICENTAPVIPLLGSTVFDIVNDPPLDARGVVEAVREAARQVGNTLTTDQAKSIADRYPLQLDGLEGAVLLARNGSKNSETSHAQLEVFKSACRQIASLGVSNLVDRIEPAFSLDEVILPNDIKSQLIEIVDQVRFADRVMEGWKFGKELPYGRGVAALLSGPSGVGKTMAAMAVANELGIQLLRLDLSKVVSKYIGETEKNISQIFTDARRSGAAVLIDEADALFGRRSAVEHAHDRYANIEVAYLLQAIENFQNVVILTTNLSKNIDPAFLRRLRFVIDFPKPDVDARERIWRQCLPVGSHELDDAKFRLLARRVDLTGGQIRQITLRAAFLAAAVDRRILLEDVARATHAELTKLGMPAIEIVSTDDRRAAA